MGNTRVPRKQLLCLPILLALLSWCCIDGPIEPVLPTWDVTMTVPVLEKTYTLAELVPVPGPITVTLTHVFICDTTLLGDTTGDGSAGKRLDEEAIRNVNKGIIHIEIENGIPMDLAMKVDLLDEGGRFLLALPKAVGDSLRVISGTIADGELKAPTTSRQTIELSGADCRQFNPAQLVRYVLTLATPPGESPNFRGTETLRIRMWAQLSYRVDI